MISEFIYAVVLISISFVIVFFIAVAISLHKFSNSQKQVINSMINKVAEQEKAILLSKGKLIQEQLLEKECELTNSLNLSTVHKKMNKWEFIQK